MGCQMKPKKEPIKFKVPEKKQLKKVKPKTYKAPYLNDQNAIPFFYEYAQKNKENKVRITTKFGDIDVLLYDNTPYHRANFIFLTKKKYFDGTMFHRVVRDPVPFVVQGGDPTSKDRSTLTSQLGSGSFVDPESGQARMIPLELKFTNEETPRYSRVVTNPSELSTLALMHERGAVAMARSQSPDSASAQFYIALKPLPELDGRYAVFGRVTNGLEVVDAIRQGDRITQAVVEP